MTHYLVAADVDQIQAFLFRSSHLREVIGGSRLLASFCDEEKEKLGDKVIISAGGSFRLEFEDRREAIHYLEGLAERFRTRTGGTLTVAGPEPYEDGGFRAANKRLQLKLLESKLQRPGFEAAAHLPIIAFCASCGTELSAAYTSPTPERTNAPDNKTYLCDSCLKRAQFRHDEQNSFYNDFRDALRLVFSRHSWDFPGDPADALGQMDPTQYVAYLVADGNGMGRLFDRQPDRESLQSLSNRLTKALWASLAAPAPDLILRLEELGFAAEECPIIPLIVGGDDLFALLPARYALDTARRVCTKFEEAMGEHATLSAAVVICQSHYPYTLAHEYGEQMLSQAKKLAKSLGGVSTISFDVIVGNELPLAVAEGQVYRSTLKPYFTGSYMKGHEKAGIDLSALLDARRELKTLPGKRKAELRVLFDPSRMKELEEQQKRLLWEQRLDTLRSRLPDEIRESLNKALAALGGAGFKSARDIWRILRRPNEIAEPHAHGLLDLIDAWDYAYQLDLPDMVYEAEEI